jgi:hypothetical protein
MIQNNQSLEWNPLLHLWKDISSGLQSSVEVAFLFCVRQSAYVWCVWKNTSPQMWHERDIKWNYIELTATQMVLNLPGGRYLGLDVGPYDFCGRRDLLSDPIVLLWHLGIYNFRATLVSRILLHTFFHGRPECMRCRLLSPPNYENVGNSWERKCRATMVKITPVTSSSCIHLPPMSFAATTRQQDGTRTIYTRISLAHQAVSVSTWAKVDYVFNVSVKPFLISLFPEDCI